MANRSREQAREALLDAGLEVFLERLSTDESLQATLSSVAFSEITRRAGYKSPGIAYYVWAETGDRDASRRAFEEDLLQRIVEIASLNVGVSSELNVELGPTDAHLLRLADAMARSTWQATQGSPTTQLWELLSFLRDVDAVKALNSAAEVAALDEMGQLVDAVLVPLQRRFRGTFTTREFLVAARSLLSAMIGMSELNPDYAEYHSHEVDGIDEPVSLYGFCLFAIIEHMTEPIPE